MPMRSLAILLLCLATAGLEPDRAAAHPHEFVETHLTFETDAEGRLASVHVVWVWDELMSLLTLEDLDLDRDGDGMLSPEERADLAVRFSDWPDDYAGDLSLRVAGQAIPLGRPDEMIVTLSEGQFTLDFRRPLTAPIPTEGLTLQLQAYDPTYYIYYDVPDLPAITSDPTCDVTRTEADLGAARSLYERLLGGLTEEQILMQDQGPLVGDAFADIFTLSCAG